MTAPRVLISGASIAGPALAHWLSRAGWPVTVVERFDGLREAGQNIDVRGAGREVARRMGLEDAIRAANTGEVGLEFVDRGGGALASFPVRAQETGGGTAELEILRGDLSRLIVESASEGVDYVFGDQITGLDDDGDQVAVSFRHGPEQTFDVVVLAEGLTSRTRSLIFPDAATRPLGVTMAYLTIPRTAADTDWWRWYQAPRGRVVTLRPDNVGTIRATLSFRTDVRGLDDLEPPAQAQVLRRTFADAGWEAERVLAGLEKAPFYFEEAGQMRLPAWSAGRVGLLGDAAYCASPVSGMGTSLSLVGAYLLAGELTSTDDPRAAFAGFETRMRPYVDRAQNLPPGVPALAHPRSRAGVATLRGAVRVAGRFAPLVDKLTAPPADKIDLPDYAVLR